MIAATAAKDVAILAALGLAYIVALAAGSIGRGIARRTPGVRRWTA